MHRCCIDTEELNAILPATASRYKGIVTPLCIYRSKERKTSFLSMEFGLDSFM